MQRRDFLLATVAQRRAAAPGGACSMKRRDFLLAALDLLLQPPEAHVP